MEKFEETIREIFYLIGEHGISKKPLDFDNPENISESDKKEFLIEVRKGFRLGQAKIIDEIIPLLKSQKEIGTKQPQVKKEKNKEKLGEILNEKKLVDHKIKILRHFADFIAWQIFKNDYYKARRFFSGSRSRPDLLHSNLASVLAAVEQFHSENEINFALISDLTSFIDIGDILLITETAFYIVECKSGDVQQKVFDFIEELKRDDYDPEKIDYNDKDLKFFDQVHRTLKQLKKGEIVSNFLNSEQGPDPFSEVNINVFEAQNPTKYFFKYLRQLIIESQTDNSSYGDIEKIIYIAIYRKDKIIPSPYIFEYMVKETLVEYVTVDYLTVLNIPLKEPLFFKPFGREVIFDLMFGRLKIYLALDLVKFIDLFNKRGIEAKWLSRKDTHKLLGANKKYKPFIHKNRAIQVSPNGRPIVLGDSFVIYLLLDNVTPESLVERYKCIK